MRRLILLLIVALMPLAAQAEGEIAGEFDYYVLSLSWTPTFCALEGDAKNRAQCEGGLGHGWTLHGLWPQFHRGWPSNCPTVERPPSRAMTGSMADIMGSGGLAWHQWNKHGRCSGLTAEEYFALSRRAYEAVNRPAVFRKLDRAVKVPAKVVEEAFLKANDGLEPDMLTITCKGGRIQEARLCLSKDLDPVPCGADVIRDCRMDDALLAPMR